MLETPSRQSGRDAVLGAFVPEKLAVYQCLMTPSRRIQSQAPRERARPLTPTPESTMHAAPSPRRLSSVCGPSEGASVARQLAIEWTADPTPTTLEHVRRRGARPHSNVR